MHVRTALLSDLADLLTFEQGIITAERPFDPTLKPGEIHYYDLAELINSENSEVIVAEVEGKLVGSGYAKTLTAKPYLQHEKYAYLGFMYVLPEYRGQGVNQAIVSELLAWAKNRGLSEVRLEVYDENISAKKAYEKVGFRGHMLEMRLAVE